MKFSLKMSKGFIQDYYRLAIPAIIAQVVVYIVDNLNLAILGTLSERAISAYTIANESYNFYFFLALGLTGGFHVYISQLYGAGNKEKYNQVFRIGIRVLIGVGLTVSALVFLFSRQFCLFFTDEEALIADAVQYLHFFSWTLVLYGINLLFSGMYSIVGKSVVAMYSGTVNCVVSLVMAYILVLGPFGLPSLGLQGAALAILIGRLAEFVFLLFMLNRKDSEFRMDVKYPKMQGSNLLVVFKTALPLIANETLYSTGMLLVVKNYSFINAELLGCYTVVQNCNKLFFVAIQGFATATGKMIGGNLGRGDKEAARQAGSDILKMGGWIHVIFNVPLLLLSTVIPSFFSMSGEIARVCTQMIWIKSVSGLIAVFTSAHYNILRVGGDVKHIFIMDGMFTLLIQCGASYVFSHLIPLSFVGCFAMTEAMYIIKLALGTYFYYKKDWLTQLS